MKHREDIEATQPSSLQGLVTLPTSKVDLSTWFLLLVESCSGFDNFDRIMRYLVVQDLLFSPYISFPGHGLFDSPFVL